nr:hypothetical protein [Tanacetum cinerariifolium]
RGMEGSSIRATLVPTLRLGKRLGPPPSVIVTSVSGPAHFGTLAHASTSRCSLALGGMRRMDSLDALACSALSREAEYDKILEDDFGTATRGEEIELTLFFLAPGPYHMPYPYKELSNLVNVLSALLVSYGYELNSSYIYLVTSTVHLQYNFNQKKGDVKLLCSKVTSLDKKLEKVKRDCDALGEENRDLRSQRDVASKEVAVAVGGALFEVTQILLDKLVHSAALALISSSVVNEASDQMLLNHAPDDSTSSI